MSDPIFPLPPVAEGTTQIDIEDNDGWLRLEALERGATAVANSPSVSTDGTVYVVGASPTGAFASFSQNDIAIVYGGTWYAWAPVNYVTLNIGGISYQYNSGWSPVSNDRSTVTSV